jgi:hypothetical protein
MTKKTLLWTALLGVALAASPALALKGGTTKVRPETRKWITEIVGSSQVLLNTGTYAIVEAKGPSNPDKLKLVTAKCPDQMRAVSAGASAASSRGEPLDFRLSLSAVSDDGSGWTMGGNFDGTGAITNNVGNMPAPYDWSLWVRLVCLKV